MRCWLRRHTWKMDYFNQAVDEDRLHCSARIVCAKCEKPFTTKVWMDYYRMAEELGLTIPPQTWLQALVHDYADA